MGQHSGIGVIDKAAAILNAVAQGPASLSELQDRTGMPRATAHRLAVALEVHRLISRDGDGRFACGPRLGELAARAIDPLLANADEILAWVRDRSGESAQLYRRDGEDRVCVATAERASGLRNTVPLGTRLPLTAGSGAQILCAWEPAETLDSFLSQAEFSRRSLADVRRRGWAQSVGQRETGVASVSAPVFDAARQVVAAVSISGPIDRLGRSPGLRFAPVLVAAADRLARTLR